MSTPDYIALMDSADDFSDLRAAVCGLLLAFPEVSGGVVQGTAVDALSGDLLVTGQFRRQRIYRITITEEPS